jgi:hypothetical protein
VGVWKGVIAGWHSFSRFVKFQIGDVEELVFGPMLGVGVLMNC